MSDPAVAVDSSIGTLASIASELGPFLFSILFLIVITGAAYSWYGRCAAQTPSDPQMLKVCRVWFVLSFSVGLLCTGLSLAWWFHQHLEKVYVYQVTVQGHPSQQVINSAYFQRMVPEAINVAPSEARFQDLKWDTQLLIVQDSEFSPNQKFQLAAIWNGEPGACANGQATVFPLDLQYLGNPQDTYQLEWPLGASPKLKPLSTRLAGNPP